MGFNWMLLIIFCASSQASSCSFTNASYNATKLYCLSDKSHIVISVPCPYDSSYVDLKFLLIEYENVTHSCEVNKTSKSCTGQKFDVGFQFKDLSPTFTVNVTSGGIFSCKTAGIYPPPYKHFPAKEAHIVYVKDSCRPSNETNSNDKKVGKTPVFPWIWVSVLGLLSIYSLAVSVIALMIWFKLKNVDNHNDYMNTKPQRQRRRKYKVQNPNPTYF